MFWIPSDAIPGKNSCATALEGDPTYKNMLEATPVVGRMPWKHTQAFGLDIRFVESLRMSSVVERYLHEPYEFF